MIIASDDMSEFIDRCINAAFDMGYVVDGSSTGDVLTLEITGISIDVGVSDG